MIRRQGKLDGTRSGTIAYLEDHGTVVQLWIRVGQRTVVACGDGNLTRRALQLMFDGASPVGMDVEFDSEGWGGLKFIAPA